MVDSQRKLWTAIKSIFKILDIFILLKWPSFLLLCGRQTQSLMMGRLNENVAQQIRFVKWCSKCDYERDI